MPAATLLPAISAHAGVLHARTPVRPPAGGLLPSRGAAQLMPATGRFAPAPQRMAVVAQAGGSNDFPARAARMITEPYSRVTLQGDDPDGADKGPFSNMFWGGLGAFVAMTVMGLIDTVIAPTGLPFMVGSFGTISILLFGAPDAPVLNKWNIIMGHLGSAAIVVAVMSVMGPTMWCRSVAFGLTVAYMMKCGCVHPPGGALVLICVDSVKAQALGWTYLLYPALPGALLLMAMAAVVDWLKANVRFELEDVLPFGKAEPPTPKFA